MTLIDTHCHIDVSEFDADRDEVLQRCAAQGIGCMVVPGIVRSTWPALLDLCDTHDSLYPALGLHPVYIDQHDESDLDELERLLGKENIVAVGEIGLDYYVDELDRDRQQFFLEAQLKIAAKYQLPVLLHVRKAHDQVISTLKRTGATGGIAHAFNGSAQQASQYISMGFKLGFGGTMTFEHSTKIRKLARELPLDSIVLETDAPDMTVASHHGERNSPEYLPECLQALSTIRNIPADELAEQMMLNTKSVLNINGNM